MITLGPHLSLADDRLDYAPGETLEGFSSVGDLDLDELTAVELSVLWHTEGKGDADLAVHYFRRWEATAANRLELKQLQPFSTRLPLSPLSYAGRIIKICWSVRLRVCMRRGKDVLVDLPFRLGAVPPLEAIDHEPG